jgi:hypothetical protein
VRPGAPEPYLSDGDLWLIDALGCALATLVLADVLGARWRLYRMPKRYKDALQNCTVIAGLPKGREADPNSIVYSAVIRSVIHGQPWEPEALRGLYEYPTTL